MSSVLKLNKKDYPLLGISISIFLHILLFFSAALILNLTVDDSSERPLYLQIVTSEENSAEEIVEEKKTDQPEKKEEVVKPEEKTENKIPEKPAAGNVYFESLIENADTSNLNQLYKESTLNVRIKYPSGWTYIDQNVKNKLDGVTFWSVKGNYSPPPYIHLEVKEKYLFNPSRFKFNYEAANYIIYYNEPEEIAGQVSQILYIRTESDEDYSLKLIMKGKESFDSFQPVFFSMVKSFKFGRTFF